MLPRTRASERVRARITRSRQQRAIITENEVEEQEARLEALAVSFLYLMLFVHVSPFVFFRVYSTGFYTLYNFQSCRISVPVQGCVRAIYVSLFL